MSAKQLIFDEAARQKLLRGVETLSRAVKVTLRPKGRNVVIDKKFGAPTITKDGVTVAKEVDLPDPLREHGRPDGEGSRLPARPDAAGDGTTTATLPRRRHLPRRPEERDGRLATRSSSSAESTRAVEAAVSGSSPGSPQEGLRPRRDPPWSPPSQPIGTTRSATSSPTPMDKVGKDGNDHGRGSQVDRNHPRCRRGHAVRQGLPVALLHDQCREPGS